MLKLRARFFYFLGHFAAWMALGMVDGNAFNLALTEGDWMPLRWFILLEVVCVLSYLILTFSSPGVLKPPREPAGDTEEENLLQKGCEYTIIRKGKGEVLRHGRYCPGCKFIRPPRAWHCSYCRYCVAQWDHHCKFSQNCIGFNNHRYFLLFLWTHFFLLSWALRVTWASMFSENGAIEWEDWAPYELVVRPGILTGTAVGTWLCFFCGSVHIWLAITNQTLLDLFIWQGPRSDIKFRLFGRTTRCLNPWPEDSYHKGFTRNLFNFFAGRVDEVVLETRAPLEDANVQ